MSSIVKGESRRRWLVVVACAALWVASSEAQAQSLLYDNGPLVNSPGTGDGGADESVLQTTSLGMTTLGFGHQDFAPNRVADDFTVPDGQVWHVETMDFYAYQTNSPTTSTISAMNVEVWDGPPAVRGSSVIFGDTTTDRLESTGFSGIYRVLEETSGNTQRPVMLTTVRLDGGVVLFPGAYWVDWQAGGSGSFSGPWAPPITINGLTTTGNGLQSTTGEPYGSALDTGTQTQQGFPFQIYGTSLTNGQCISMQIAANCKGLTGRDRSRCVHEQQASCHAAFDIPSNHVDEEAL